MPSLPSFSFLTFSHSLPPLLSISPLSHCSHSFLASVFSYRVPAQASNAISIPNGSGDGVSTTPPMSPASLNKRKLDPIEKRHNDEYPDFVHFVLFMRVCYNLIATKKIRQYQQEMVLLLKYLLVALFTLQST